jgi:hypothetical protein
MHTRVESKIIEMSKVLDMKLTTPCLKVSFLAHLQLNVPVSFAMSVAQLRNLRMDFHEILFWEGLLKLMDTFQF